VVGKLPRYIWWCIENKISFYIHGSPGLGKSWTIAKLCADRTLQLQDERLSQYDSVDLRGLPDLDGNKRRTCWIPPEMLPYEDSRPGLLFLDEFSDSQDDVKKAAYQLIHDRKLGSYKLPDNWAIGGAGNLITDMSFVTRNPAALNNRFIHFYVYCEIKDWTAMASASGIHPMIIGFLNWKPSWLHAFQGMEEGELQTFIKNSEAWHSPRTWEGVSKVIHSFGTSEDEFKEAEILIAGFVGLPAMSEFSGYVKYYSKLPDLDDLIANPESHRCPEETPVQFALASALALRIEEDNFSQILKFMRKMPGEMQGSMMASAVRRNDQLIDTDEFIKWSVDNQTNMF